MASSQGIDNRSFESEGSTPHPLPNVPIHNHLAEKTDVFLKDSDKSIRLEGEAIPMPNSNGLAHHDENLNGVIKPHPQPKQENQETPPQPVSVFKLVSLL